MREATERLLASRTPLEVIDGCFIPALDEVGARFEKGELFLPQLMASAEAVKAGFDAVRAAAPAAAGASKGSIVLATVKGDIHDIGKNIVKMLLENYGYRVYDLGRDVDPQLVLDAVRAHGVQLVGLSALMTTTVRAMEETIALLRREAPDVRVMVGGAVLTPEYARMVGADWYAKDAAESARIAGEFFAQEG
jgi:5-methyltetrahydrofolate--homocysteine methyltransferase